MLRTNYDFILVDIFNKIKEVDPEEYALFTIWYKDLYFIDLSTFRYKFKGVIKYEGRHIKVDFDRDRDYPDMTYKIDHCSLLGMNVISVYKDLDLVDVEDWGKRCR